MVKRRADILLVEQGLFESHARARAGIMAGAVRVGPDRVVRNAAERWEDDTVFTVRDRYRFVGRGALKLQPALDRHLPRLDGLTAIDVGASTGGFTDLMLQRGATRVYAVDVGYGQLHLRLRRDARVVVLERLNARQLTREHVPDSVHVATVDVSFISLRHVLPPLTRLLAPSAWVFALVKPQFEARRREVGQGGIVRDPDVRERVNAAIVEFAAGLSWRHCGSVPAGVAGAKGNRETVCVFRTPQPR